MYCRLCNLLQFIIMRWNGIPRSNWEWNTTNEHGERATDDRRWHMPCKPEWTCWAGRNSARNGPCDDKRNSEFLLRKSESTKKEPFDQSGRVVAVAGAVEPLQLVEQVAQFALRWAVKSSDDEQQTGVGEVEECTGDGMVPHQPRLERAARKTSQHHINQRQAQRYSCNSSNHRLFDHFHSFHSTQMLSDYLESKN